MKKNFILIILAGWLVLPAFAQHPSQDNNWAVVFKDDFSTDFTYTWGNHRWYKSYGAKDAGKNSEEMHYCTYENVYTENGKLVLRTQKQNSPPCVPNCIYGGIHKYTSGVLVSNAKYQYGYFEVYAQLPVGGGFFPAFWLWSNDSTPSYWYNEIDIMEANGGTPTFTSSNYDVFLDTASNQEHNVAIKHPCYYGDGSYHWYGAEWDRDKITFYIDKKTVRQVANNDKGEGVQHPMEILISFQLFSDSWCHYASCVSDSTVFPNYMRVDECNVHQLQYDCAKNEPINHFNDFANYVYKVKKSITLGGSTVLPAGSNISLRATDFIELKDGFTIADGAELYLDTNPCEGTVGKKVN